MCPSSVKLRDKILYTLFPEYLPSSQPTLFDYFLNIDKKQWHAWKWLVPEYIHDPSKKFSEILVPTIDTERSTWLLRLMIKVCVLY